MTKKKSFSEAWETLLARHAKGRAGPPAVLPFMRATDIRLCPEVFQHRRPNKSDSDAHVRELARGAQQSGALDPISIWWDGKAWLCIDGHHRLRAYWAAGMSDSAVPVAAFSGSPAEALAEAASRNTRDKLKMGRAEKMTTAWRIVTVGGFTKAATANASGVSPRTVAYMRRVAATLTERGMDCKALTWEAARRLDAGQPEVEVDWDQEIEKRAQEMATKISASIGREGSKQPEAFARALELYDSRMPSRLMEHWHGMDEETVGDAE